MKVLGIVSTIALTSASDTKDRFEEASALCQMLQWEEAKLILNEEIERLGKMDIQSEDAIDYLDKFVMLGVVAEESSGSKKRAENLLEKYCPVVEEIHGFAASKTGHCYQSLLAMYGRSSKPRDFYTLLEFVRTKHEIESSCAQHPHISTCSSNLYKFDADRKNALVYSSQRMNSAITNYFRASGRERKEMVRVSNIVTIRTTHSTTKSYRYETLEIFRIVFRASTRFKKVLMVQSRIRVVIC